jgi:plastocyanin
MSNRTARPFLFVLTVVCAVTLGAACSSDSKSTTAASSSSNSTSASSTSSSSSAPATGGTEVTIKDFKFGPDTLQVKVGATVTFTNADGQQHTATSDDSGAFDAGAIDPAGSKGVTFDKAGTFTYHCSFHPFMHGTIEVS